MQHWIVPIAVALIAPFFAYITAVRKLSGRIDTSDAALLWDESTRLRQEWRQRAELCERAMVSIRNEIQVVHARNTILRRENTKLRSDLKKCIERNGGQPGE